MSNKPLPDPTHRVEYTDSNGGFVSETAYSTIAAEVKANMASDAGAKDVTITPFGSTDNNR